MKKDIHPGIHLIDVHCACGHTFKTQSTQKDLRVEICSKCHPFFTGKQKIIDSAGRVERFQRKYAAVEKKNAEAKPEVKAEAKVETNAEPKAVTNPETKVEKKAETKGETKPDMKTETKTEKKAEAETEAKLDKKPETNVETGEKEGGDAPPAAKE